MAEASEKAEVVPVKAGKEAERTHPTRARGPFEEMERMFEEFLPGSWLRPHRWGWPAFGDLAAPFEGRAPKVDIIDREDEILVRAELPGVDKKDIDLSMTDNTITIKGATRKDEKEERGDYYRCETTRGAISRTLALPADVKTDKATAKFKDGVLELILPKMERAKRRSIKVD